MSSLIRQYLTQHTIDEKFGCTSLHLSILPNYMMSNYY